MEFSQNKVRIGFNKDGTKNVYYDVTEEFFRTDRPDYIEKAEIVLGYIYDDIKTGTPHEMFQNRAGQDYGGFKVRNGEIKNDEKEILITFRDGLQIEFWNSEWGGLYLSENK